jgi:hypothetical protein
MTRAEISCGGPMKKKEMGWTLRGENWDKA